MLASSLLCIGNFEYFFNITNSVVCGDFIVLSEFLSLFTVNITFHLLKFCLINCRRFCNMSYVFIFSIPILNAIKLLATKYLISPQTPNLPLRTLLPLCNPNTANI